MIKQLARNSASAAVIATVGAAVWLLDPLGLIHDTSPKKNAHNHEQALLNEANLVLGGKNAKTLKGAAERRGNHSNFAGSRKTASHKNSANIKDRLAMRGHQSSTQLDPHDDTKSDQKENSKKREHQNLKDSQSNKQNDLANSKKNQKTPSFSSSSESSYAHNNSPAPAPNSHDGPTPSSDSGPAPSSNDHGNSPQSQNGENGDKGGRVFAGGGGLESDGNDDSSSDGGSSSGGDSGNDQGGDSGSDILSDQVGPEPRLYGEVPPLKTLMSSIPMALPLSKAYASTCSSATLKIFKLDSYVPGASTAVYTKTLDSTAEFEIKDPILDFSNVKPNNYLLRVIGCNKIYESVAHSYQEKIIIDEVSSLFAKTKESEVNVKVPEADEIKFKQTLREALLSSDADTMNDAYTELSSQSEFTGMFSETFESDFSKVAYSAPDINSLTIPTNINELETTTFEVDASHWNPLYDLQVEWIIDNQFVGTGQSFAHIPPGNAKEFYNLKVRVGHKESTSTRVDQNLPHYNYEYTFQVNDSTPIQAPTIQLASGQSDPTNNSGVSLEILTGSSMNNCESLSKLYLSEDSTAPTDESVYDKVCDTANAQAESFTISSGDETKTIFLHAIDARGETSTTSTTIDLDTTPPQISWGTISNYKGFRSSQSFSFQVTEAHAIDSQDATVEIHDGSSWSTIATVDIPSGDLSNQSFSGTYDFPYPESSGYKLRVTLEDILGQSTQLESNTFDIEAPVLSSTGNIDYGDQLNKSSTSATWTITNDGSDATFGCSQATLSDSTDFTIDTDNCQNSEVAVGDSCSVDVSFTPQSKGTGKSSTLNWNCTNEQISVSLSGNSLNNPPEAAADETLTTRDDVDFDFTLPEASDIDNAQSDISYILTSAPSTGTLSNCLNTSTYTQDLNCTYRAPVNFDGQVTLSYLANDGTDDAETETTITITVNDETPTQPNLSPENFDPDVGTNNVPITLTAADCQDISKIMIQESSTAPTTSDSGWQTCSTATGALTFDPTISNEQGFRTLRIYGQDAHGNISDAQLVNFIFDNQAPILTFENVPTVPNGIDYPIEWTMTEATISGSETFTLEYSVDNGSTWTEIGTPSVGTDGPHTDKLYQHSWTVPSGTYTEAYFRVSVTDGNGLSTTSTSNKFSIVNDTEAPNLVSDSMTINGSATPPLTTKNVVYVSFDAIDNDTNITHFCLKNTSTKPSLDHDCWTAVDAPNPGLTPATELNLRDYPYLLGFDPQIYNVHAFVRDLGENISTNTTTSGQDVVSIEYDPDASPELTEFFVANTDTPPDPLTSNETTFDVGSDVFIKWRATDDKGITDNIELYYTTDDKNYTLITDGLVNGANNCSEVDNSGTTLDDNSTGCYKWSSPFSSTEYFRIKAKVYDTSNQSTSIVSGALNSSKFGILAGNVDPGTGSSAKSAMFMNNFHKLHSLAKTTDGKIFFNDKSRGVLYVNPETGIQELLLEKADSYSGDDGPVKDATAEKIHKITVDYNDNLLIWADQRIRKVDTSSDPMTIKTIIGGQNNGSLGTQTSETVTDPKDLKIHSGPNNGATFTPLPNGDIYFQSGPFNKTVNEGNLLRVYRGSLSSPRIESIKASGMGANNTHPTTGTIDIDDSSVKNYAIQFDPDTSSVEKIIITVNNPTSGCSFYSHANLNLSTYESDGPHPPTYISTCGDQFARTGHDGKIYRISQKVAWDVVIGRYNSSSNDYTDILGNGNQGFSPDGTAQLSAKTKITDFFMSPSGKLFFADNGLIRVVNSSGNISTLMGQTLTYGDGGLAQDARFNRIDYIDHGTGERVILYDHAELVMREIRPTETSAQVVKLAGNGETASIDFSAPANSQTLNGANWDQPGMLVSDPSTGDVYFGCVRNEVCKLTRSTGKWSKPWGGGSTNWLTTGTFAASSLNLGGYNPGYAYYHNQQFLTLHERWDGDNHVDGSMRVLDTSNGETTFLAGQSGDIGSGSCPDGPGTGCETANTDGRGKAAGYHPGQNAFIFERTNNELKLFKENGTDGQVTHFDSLSDDIKSLYYHYSQNALYYCTDQGELKKKDYGAGTTEVLPFPSDQIQCDGFRILFKPSTAEKPDRLVFPFTQNGLQGIAEYDLN